MRNFRIGKRLRKVSYLHRSLGKNKKCYNENLNSSIAQLVERRTVNP